MLFDGRILVVLDGGSHCRESLKRIRLLAEYTQIDIELLWFGKKAPWKGLEDEITALEDDFAVSKSVAKGGPVDTVKAIWEERRFGMLIKGCDEQHWALPLKKSVDWDLLRSTPCPVLLVKQSSSWRGQPVMAAVNPQSKKEHQALHDQNVLRIASTIAQAAGSPLHCAVATSPPMMAADADSQLPERIEEKAQKAAAVMFDEVGIQPDELFVGEGPTEYFVPETAKSQKAGLVIISTRARGGISAALLGNTAEQILDRINCDVLVIRPGV